MSCKQQSGRGSQLVLASARRNSLYLQHKFWRARACTHTAAEPLLIDLKTKKCRGKRVLLDYYQKVKFVLVFTYAFFESVWQSLFFSLIFVTNVIESNTSTQLQLNTACKQAPSHRYINHSISLHPIANMKFMADVQYQYPSLGLLGFMHLYIIQCVFSVCK